MDKRISFVTNDHPEYERFYSVKIGLQKISDVDYCYIQNVDNPFINQEILWNLYINRPKNGYVVPIFNNKGGHPILLAKDAIENIKTHDDNKAILKSVLSNSKRNNFDIGTDIVNVNINTRDDYKKYFGKNHD